VFGRQTQRCRWNHQQRPHCCLCYHNTHTYLVHGPAYSFLHPPLSCLICQRHTTRNSNIRLPISVWEKSIYLKVKGKNHPMTCLCTHRVQAEVRFDLIWFGLIGFGLL
jgi:hypothetical protein